MHMHSAFAYYLNSDYVTLHSDGGTRLKRKSTRARIFTFNKDYYVWSGFRGTANVYAILVLLGYQIRVAS